MLAENFTLSAEQEIAVQAIKSYNIVILVGRAGAGKTTVIQAAKRLGGITICAMTGRAAILAGGCTFDRLFAYSRDSGDCFSRSFLQRQMNSAAGTIVIDEGSMIDAAMASYIRRVAFAYQKRIVIVADWAQAKPVGGGWPFSDEIFKEAKIIRLTECHRQSERPFLDALEALRYGDSGSLDLAPLLSRVSDHHPEGWPVVLATNAEVEFLNSAAVNRIESEHPDIRLWATYTSSKKDDRGKDKAIDSSTMAHGRFFKLGCRVMIRKNQSDENGALKCVNGDTGVLVNAEISNLPSSNGVCIGATFWDDVSDADIKIESDDVLSLHIELDRSGDVIVLHRQDDQLTDPNGNVYATVSGFAISPAYAFTIHKMQGITLDRVSIDMASICKFRQEARHGLFYVACSRARTLSGLNIVNWNPDAIYCDPAALPLIKG